MRAERVGATRCSRRSSRMVERGAAQPRADPAAGRSWSRRISSRRSIAVAVVTFVVWALVGPSRAWRYALVNAVAVLIIACPVRARPGDADVDHGRHGPRRDGGRAVQERRGARDAARRWTRSSSTRPARSPKASRGWSRSPRSPASTRPTCCGSPRAWSAAASIRWRRRSSRGAEERKLDARDRRRISSR